MKISIDNNIGNKLLWITVHCSNFEEILLKKRLYKKILSQALIDSSIKLITITPQDYSLAHEISYSYLKTLKSKSFLISDVNNCDLELIEKIVASEEFERTLLLIVKKASALSDNELAEIVEIVKNRISTTIDEIVFCEDDGDSLCLYNTSIKMNELISMSSIFTTDINIETK